MKKLLYRSKSTKNPILAAAAVFSVIAFSAQTFAAETKVALCEYCNSPAFRNAAEVTALQESPRLQGGVQFVFVVDIHTDEIRYYEVVREYVETCLSTTTDTRMSSGSLIDPDDPPDIPDCFSSWVTSSTQLAPPAAEAADLRDILSDFDKFRQEIEDVDLSEIPIGIIPLDSATDLIGPASDSHDPEVFRGSLVNALSDRAAASWLANRLNEALQVAEAFVFKLVDLSLPQFITVTFPDGTKINVEIVSPFKDEHANFAGLILEVDESSARGGSSNPNSRNGGGICQCFPKWIHGECQCRRELCRSFCSRWRACDNGPA